MIKKLHHAALRCRDTEETRAFYEDFLGLRLAAAHVAEVQERGRDVTAMHSFFALADGSFLAFFDVPAETFDVKEHSPLDLHIALEVEEDTLQLVQTIAAERGIGTHGPVDHKICHSLYLRDPNGYVVELTAKSEVHDQLMAMAGSVAKVIVDKWQSDKTIAPLEPQPA